MINPVYNTRIETQEVFTLEATREMMRLYTTPIAEGLMLRDLKESESRTARASSVLNRINEYRAQVPEAERKNLLYDGLISQIEKDCKQILGIK